MPLTAREQLRKDIRQQRRALGYAQQQEHSILLAQQLSKQACFRNAKRIACYLTADGEIDPLHIIHLAWQRRKDVYLPVLSPTGQSLFFAPYTENTVMKANRFGINEPDVKPSLWLSARQLNLILLPLVAFDTQGNRLGMGGGFYDRCLSFSRYQKQQHAPHLIGLAHELQKVDCLPCEVWDVPLMAITTELTTY